MTVLLASWSLLVLSAGSALRADEAEARIVKHIKKLGGEVSGRPATRVDIPNGKAFTDEDMEVLSGLRKLEYLNLRGARITDKGVRHLAHLPQLQTLFLGSTLISDDGLRHLAGLKNLSYL